MAFDPDAVKEFRFTGFDVDAKAGVAHFRYALDEEAFEERVQWLEPTMQPSGPEFESAVRLAYLAHGVSYYKAAAPEHCVVEIDGTREHEIAFIEKLWHSGLGEYSYVNQLDLTNKPRFNVEGAAELSNRANPTSLPQRSAVMVGGGKDSCVSIEAMRNCRDIVLCAVGHHKAIEDVASVAGLPLVRIEHHLSPLLFELNAQGARNGHVPTTAMKTLLAVVGGFLYGYDEVILSNERSASVGNTMWHGEEINHQWSKGLDAERLLADVLARSVGSVRSYSLLRPLSELSIAEQFAKLTKYHGTFTSCNRAFQIDTASRTDRWCLDCDKCRFVFLILAPFLAPEAMLTIFGANLLDDETQLHGFEALLGLKEFKPFECVGEISESRAAMGRLTQDPAWKGAVVVRQAAMQGIIPDLVAWQAALEWSDDHDVPRQSLECLSATTRA